jgi:hypothetical protein
MSERKPPKIEDAPGLVWRARKSGWVATWQARSDLIKAGFSPQTARLWDGTEPTKLEAEHIATQCRRLQSEMLTFARAGEYVVDKSVKNLRQLISAYVEDPASTHRKKRYHVRRNHEHSLKRLTIERGDVELTDIKARTILLWHDVWSDGGRKVAMAHAMISHVRALVGFGATMLENDECERLSGVLHHLRFPMGRPREDVLTAAQATAVRNKAREIGWFSMALAQALQFDLMLRQKDVIGEWVPISEPGISDTTHLDHKWLRGLRWEEIDDNLVLRHTTSKKNKPMEADLKLAPMVLEELEHLLRFLGGKPAKGPLIICEATARPWKAVEFRRKWRIVADLSGVPKGVQNRDSRAGAITEATDAGADLEHIRHAATHSDISMTQKYSRGSSDKNAIVQKLRLEHRNKPKT